MRDALLTEGFETAVPPVGWTLMTTGSSHTWAQSDLTANSGDYSAHVAYGDHGQWQDEWLVTPAINTEGVGTLFLDFAESQ